MAKLEIPRREEQPPEQTLADNIALRISTLIIGCGALDVGVWGTLSTGQQLR
jgi:hypothetical protein